MLRAETGGKRGLGERENLVTLGSELRLEFAGRLPERDSGGGLPLASPKNAAAAGRRVQPEAGVICISSPSRSRRS